MGRRKIVEMKILVIRRDNIGDLVCTTPLFSALRKHYPEAKIAALVNSYNAPVLSGNPEIDNVHVYRKAKHRKPGESRLEIWWETCQLMLRLRKERFDVAIVATPALQPGAHRFARWTGARRIIAYSESAGGNSCPLTQIDGMHESELVMRLLQPLGINDAPGPLSIFADRELAARVAIPAVALPSTPLIALHISARKPAQRWPEDRFAELAHALHARFGASFLVFWSPGADNHPQHPGDDAKAGHLLALCRDIPVLACKTERLEDLIAGLSRCDYVICSDGGAMHIAAGLGKPLVCFFGNSGAERWHPWGVPYELLQPASRNVIDVSVEDALEAFDRLTQLLPRRCGNVERSVHPQ
jgi:heptosyltransferase III